MRHRDFIQNITITLLTLSAVFLFSRTQFFQLGAAAGSDYCSTSPRPSAAAKRTRLCPTASLPRCGWRSPASTADTGSVSLTTGGEEFTPVKTLLREVIGSARSLSDSSWAVFRAALETPSVYCDFLSALPVEYLSDLMGAETDLSLTVRGLAAAEQGEQVILLLWDGGSRYYQCATAVQRSALQEVLEQFDFGVSTFAFEEEAGQHLAPLSLFPDPLPELPQLTAGDAAVSTETLLTALGFNPHTNSRYVDSGGAEVIVEGDRVIRLGSSGALSYSSGGEAALTVEGSGTVPSASEAVSGALALLEQLLPEGGETTLYLSAFRRTESETHLTFSYQFNGVPIHFADGSAAAEIILTGNIISTLSLRPMLYLEDGSSALLPLRQAMAIAERRTGRAFHRLATPDVSPIRRVAGRTDVSFYVRK